MAGSDKITPPKSRARLSGLLQAGTLYLVYLALSFTDLWGALSPMIQAVTYGLLALAMVICIMRALMGRPFLTVKASLRTVVLAGILLSVGGILAGSDAKRLLEIAVKPRAIFTYPAPNITMTVTPPDYVNRPEFSERLLPGNEKSSGLTPIPEGSKITIRATNMTYAPRLIADHDAINFAPDPAGGFVAQFTVTDQISWQVREGRRRIGQWPLFILEDDAPLITQADFRHMMTGDGLFGLSLKMSDDHGLAQVTMGVMPSGGQSGGQKDLLYDRTNLAISGLTEYSGELYINLAASDFAGQKINLHVEAVDQAGQKQTKIISGISLPLRQFAHPLARKIATIRKQVKDHPEERKKLARQLMALGLGDGHVGDEQTKDGQTPAIYYMALRSAYWRLTNPIDDADVTSARQILWDLARELDDGGTAQLTEDMRRLLARLKLALYQKQGMAEAKRQLQEIDKVLILFLRHEPSQDDYNIPELRKLYSKILNHIYYNKYEQAVDLVSYLEQGFIYPEREILSGKGYARFQAILRAQDSLTIITKTQRQIMSFVHKNALPLKVASLDIKTTPAPDLALSRRKNIQKWTLLQQKLGASLTELGHILTEEGMDISSLTVTVTDLIKDTVHSMKTGDMDTAATLQSQIMIQLQNIKNIVNREKYDHPDTRMP